jgi:hydroxymethylbilane synthase
MLRAEDTGEIADPEALGNRIADALLAQGAGEILAALND